MAGFHGGSSWQSYHDACQRLHRDVWSLMSDRSNHPRTSHTYANLNEQINATMKQFSAGIERIKVDLDREKTGLTSGEYARRDGLISVLKSQQIQLQNVLSQSSVAAEKRAEEKRRQLLSQDGGGLAEVGGKVGWGGGRNNGATVTSGYGAITDGDDSPDSGIRTTDQMLREQDEGLDNLHSIIVRQRTIAETIEGEVGVQNEIIDGLGDDLERTNVHLLATTQRVQTVTRTSGVSKYWAIILLLLVIIVILVAIPS